ncbi:MAG: SUF system Fe-S cluster assembly protein [Maricaulis sp.]|uniref:SUF system Fe-S cluster assembly protein n=1 Tax=Maricaulis sp. TaxID=1486257 RepID=UPI0026137977|nr:SUF system Fe-S cluster assembly protein [Maricaulis sp.]MDM7983464.1 SUF system Fe-S cluster assembly protein [Maricaulis sp.]
MTENTARDVIDLSGTAPKEDVIAEASAELPSAEASAIPADELARITDDIVEALKTVFDPEIPVDIYELGLIYKVDLEDDRSLKVLMSLTAPGCPVAGEMPGWVQEAVEKVDGVAKALVELTFDPPWTPARMSDEARLALNMF